MSGCFAVFYFVVFYGGESVLVLHDCTSCCTTGWTRLRASAVGPPTKYGRNSRDENDLFLKIIFFGLFPTRSTPLPTGNAGGPRGGFDTVLGKLFEPRAHPPGGVVKIRQRRARVQQLYAAATRGGV